MNEPLSFVLGAVLALLVRWAVARFRSPRLSEYPIEGSEWLIDGHRVSVSDVHWDWFFVDWTRIYLRGHGRAMPWREFRRRARPLDAEHLIQSMHRPAVRLVETE